MVGCGMAFCDAHGRYERESIPAQYQAAGSCFRQRAGAVDDAGADAGVHAEVADSQFAAGIATPRNKGAESKARFLDCAVMNHLHSLREDSGEPPYDGLEALLLLEAKEWKRTKNATWRNPGWEIQDDDPVAGPCWLDAAGFCTWLTWDERRTGRIRPDQAYRLPTDEEWSAAAGLPEEPGATAVEREALWPQSAHFWIWGPAWPPPEGVVNVAGEELAKEGLLPASPATLPFSDPWLRVAPVEALPASALGFYHLCGNVEEWTESFGGREGQLDFVLRGSSWSRGHPREIMLN